MEQLLKEGFSHDQVFTADNNGQPLSLVMEDFLHSMIIAMANVRC